MTVVAAVTGIAVPHSVKMAFVLRIVVIFEGAAIVPDLVVVQILNLATLQGAFEP